jgi:hypothetical protein
VAEPAPATAKELTPEQALALRKVADGRRHDAIARGLRIGGIVLLVMTVVTALVIGGVAVVRSLRGLDEHLQGYDGQAAGTGAATGDDDAERTPALRGSGAHQGEP